MTPVLIAMRIAHRALRRNTLRSALTMLGVIIGVAAVIAMLAIGQGRRQPCGPRSPAWVPTRWLFSRARRRRAGCGMGGGHNPAGGRCPGRSQRVSSRGLRHSSPAWWLPGRVYQPELANGGAGTGIEYPIIREWAMASGEWFTSQDLDAASKVAVLGETVRSMLFGSVDPVGQVMQMNNIPFRIIGVLEPRGNRPGDRIKMT